MIAHSFVGRMRNWEYNTQYSARTTPAPHRALLIFSLLFLIFWSHIFLEEMANKDNVKSVRKDNDQLKRQMQELTKDFENVKSKMVEQRRNQASRAAQSNEKDMQFLSDQYHDLLKSGTSLEEEIGKLSRKLDALVKDVHRIDKAIDDILSYSYQYNLKIVGVPQIKENESAYETTNLCLKMFSALGNDISVLEIDIAHRVQQRGAVTNNGRPKRPNPIVCKFTRRLTHDAILALRSNSGQLTAEALGLPPTSMVNCILIFPHLTPRLHDLLPAAGPRKPELSFTRQTHQE